MSEPALTEDERDQMAHAIGHHSAKGCSVKGGRNHYVTQTGDPLWVGLVERGLARCRSSSMLPADESVFHVTDEGRAVLEADPRSQRPPVTGRGFTVYFRGYPDCPIHVTADSHAKARYAAVQCVEDAFNFTSAEGFRQIESCRLS
jgi:hypothetical protein